MKVGTDGISYKPPDEPRSWNSRRYYHKGGTDAAGRLLGESLHIEIA
jgi:hypothetical protein